jgi:hypothetical protein
MYSHTNIQSGLSVKQKASGIIPSKMKTCWMNEYSDCQDQQESLIEINKAGYK